MVECRTPEREVGGSKPTAAVLCPWARHFTSRKYWLITQEAMAPSRHDWKIVDWDVKPQHKQNYRDAAGSKNLCCNIRNRCLFICIKYKNFCRKMWAMPWENLFMPYANNKGADRPARPHSLISTFVVRCLDSITSLIVIFEVSRLELACVSVQAGLSHTWSKTPKTGFLMT